jgi:hypothetical protein
LAAVVLGAVVLVPARAFAAAVATSVVDFLEAVVVDLATLVFCVFETMLYTLF